MEVRLFEILLDDDDFIKVGIIKLFRKKKRKGMMVGKWKGKWLL